MATSHKRRLQLDKARLQNPYAHIEELEPSSSSKDMNAAQSAASTLEINATRRRLQDPYAFLDGEDNFSAYQTNIKSTGEPANGAQAPRKPLQIQSKKAAGSYSNSEIESVARGLQLYVWRNRHSLWGNNAPDDPIGVLNIEVALNLLGYEYLEVEGLSSSGGVENRAQVAGVIDAASKKVFISGQQENSVKRFTGAHELGHAALHEFHASIHRDRPLNGEVMQKAPQEKEADKFANYFLMPEKLIRQHFRERFGDGTFSLDEDRAFALGKDLGELEKELKSLRDVSLLLAIGSVYNGRRFSSLAEIFGVSKTAMAIRLEELGLVQF